MRRTNDKRALSVSLFWFLAISVHLAWSTPNPPGDVTSRIDTFVATEMHKENIPGVALAVIKGGTVTLAKG